MAITVIVKPKDMLPKCMPCQMTTDFLTKRGVAFEVLEGAPGTPEFQRMKEAGISSYPAVFGGAKPFGGHQPQLLEELIAAA